MNGSTPYLKRSTASYHSTERGCSVPTTARSVPHGSCSQYSRTSAFGVSVPFTDHVPQRIERPLRVRTPRVPLHRACTSRGAESRPQVAVVEQRPQSGSERVDVPGFDE